MKWQCESLTEKKSELKDIFYRPSTKEVKLNAFTVGQITRWQCRGDSPVSDVTGWNVKLFETKEVAQPKKGEAKLKKEEVKQKTFYLKKLDWIDESTVNLEMSFYQLNRKKWEFELIKDKDMIELSGIEPKIESVLPFHELKEKQQELKEGEENLQAQAKPAPYPAIGGIGVSYPSYLWLGLLLFILLSVSAVLWRYKKTAEIKKFRNDLRRKNIAITPVNFFYKELRSLYRFHGEDEEYLSKLKDAYVSYLMYRFAIPAKSWSAKKIYLFLKNEQTDLKDKDLLQTKSYLQEFEKLSEIQFDREQASDFIEKIQKNVEKLDKNAKKVDL